MDNTQPSQPFTPKFGEQEYSTTEKSAISQLLEQKLGADEVAFRQGAGSSEFLELCDDNWVLILLRQRRIFRDMESDRTRQ